MERELKIAMDSLSLNVPSPTFKTEVYKHIARINLNDKVDDKTLERIDKEIEGLEGIDNQLKNELA